MKRNWNGILRSVLLGLLTALPTALLAAQAQKVYISWSWIDGELKDRPDKDDGYYVKVEGASSYGQQVVTVTGATVFRARVTEGHEVTAWSYGNLADTGIALNVGHFATVVSNGLDTITYTPPSGTQDRCLSCHQEWLTYTISFNGNGATSGSTDALESVYTNQVALTRNGFTKNGYRFVGWAETAKGAKAYDDEAIDQWGKTLGFDYQNKTKTLYAVWEPVTVSVTFDAAGGTFEDGTSQRVLTQTFDAKYALPTDVPTRGGFTRENYWTNSVGNQVTSATTVNTASDHILYAVWRSVGLLRVDGYVVKDDAQAGGTVDGSGSFEYGAARKLQANANTGSRFVCWTIDSEDGEVVSENPTLDFQVTRPVTYYAHFKLEEYTVTFAYKDAEGNPASMAETVRYGEAATPPTVPDYPHYRFTKWDSSDYRSVKGDLTVTALYESTVLTVNFNGNASDASVSIDVLQYDVGDFYGELPDATRQGYTSTGWWTRMSGGDRIVPTTEVKDAGNQVLYAQWTNNVYTVTFDANGGDAPSVRSIRVTYDRTYPQLATVARTGYVFDGWFTFDGAPILSTSTVVIAGDHTLYAHWTAKTFWVNLDARGGSVSPKSIEVTYDKKYADLNDAVRTGYEFLGWYTAVEGGDRIVNGDRVQITSGQNLYAQWKAETHVVTFEANGGTATEASRIQTFGQAYGKLPEATRTGYDFGGWYTADDRRIYETTRFEETSDLTLTAKWTAKKFTLYFDSNGGRGYTSSQSFVWDVPQPLSANGFERTGHTYLGWHEDAESAVARFADQQIVSNLTEATTYTLKAVWRANAYTVRFAANGGTGTMDEIAATYGQPFELPPCAFVNGVQTFRGWKDASGRLIADGATVSDLTAEDKAVVELTAQWSDDYVISFVPNGATGGEMKDVVAGVTESVTLPPNAFVRTGYHFLGWATSADATKAEYTDAASVRGLGASGARVALYAVWEANAYVVRYYPNGGQGEPYEQTFAYDKAQALLANRFASSNKDFVFDGWATDPLGEKVYADAEPEVRNLTDRDGVSVPFFAKWTRAGGAGDALSEALDCATEVVNDHVALAFTTSSVPYVTLVSGYPDKGGNGKCVQLSVASYGDLVSLDTRISGSGTLSFAYATSVVWGEDEHPETSEGELTSFTVTLEGQYDDLLTVRATKEAWQEFSLHLDVGETPRTLSFNLTVPFDLSDYALIDCVKWNPDSWAVGTVGVTFRTNDGTSAPFDIVTNATYEVGAAFGNLPVLASESFLGWATTATATVPDVTGETLVPSADTVLYAVWTKEERPEPEPQDAPTIGGFVAGAGGLVLASTSDVRFDYLLEVTDSLAADEVDWQPVGEAVSGTGEALEWVLPKDPSVRRRFYRVRVMRKP